MDQTAWSSFIKNKTQRDTPNIKHAAHKQNRDTPCYYTVGPLASNLELYTENRDDVSLNYRFYVQKMQNANLSYFNVWSDKKESNMATYF